MIIEIVGEVVAGGTICFVASLRFAKWIVQHQTEREDADDPIAAKRAAIAKKRAIIQRDWDGWKYSSASVTRDKRMMELDKQLMVLADEEAALATDPYAPTSET